MSWLVCGRVYGTGDPSLEGGSCAIKVSRGSIVELKRMDDVELPEAPLEMQVDLRDGTVVPGFIDAHNHQPSAARDALEVSTAHVDSVDALITELAKAAEGTPAGDWLVTERSLTRAQIRGWRFPTAAELDRASTRHPIAVRFGAHAAALNHAALTATRLAGMYVDPAGGWIERDEHGRPAGAIHEYGALRYLEAVVPVRSDDQLVESLAAVQRSYVRTGITSVRVPGVRPGELTWYQALRRRGELGTRTFACVRLDPNLSLEDKCDFVDSWEVTSGFGDDWLALDALKLFVDGGVDGQDDDHQFFVGSHELATVVDHAVSRGWAVTCHAVASRAVDMVLHAFTVARRHHGMRPRLCIEHGLFMTPEQLRQAHATDVWLSTQPGLLDINAHVLDGLPPAEREAFCPIRTALSLGVEVALGSDWNATPATDVRPFSPLRTLAAAIRPRRETIRSATALDLHTRSGAALVRRHHLGRVRAGCRADLVVYAGRPQLDDLTRDELRSPSDVFVDGAARVRDGQWIAGSADEGSPR